MCSNVAYILLPTQVDDLKRRQELVEETSKIRKQFEAMKKKRLDFDAVHMEEQEPYKQKITYKKFNYDD